jgi:hypothetical protein
VAGRELLRSRTTRKCEQVAETESPVALDAGIRRLSALITAHERLDHGAAKVIAEIERDVRDAEGVTGRARRKNRLGRATRSFRVGPVGVEPQPQRDSHCMRQ